MGEEQKKDEQQGFTVSDRRRRYQEDDAGADQPSQEAETQPKTEAPATAEAATGAENGSEAGPAMPEPGPGEATPEGAEGPVGPANFVQLVGKLYEEALVFMGYHDDPQSGHSMKNLQVASWHIDILVVLQEKSKGNLNAEETKLLEDAVANLKVLFVRASGFIK